MGLRLEIDNPLVDSSHRRMRKLRVSLLDACNFRCQYCMPQKVHFTPQNLLMSPGEIEFIVGNLVKMGIEEIRFTGGEPTLRSELVEIVERISRLKKPPKKISMTTNGLLLKPLLSDLKNKTKLTHLNISLDSLKEEAFNKISRFKMSGALNKVIDSIDHAIDLGFKVKINSVLMKSQFSELFDLLEFARIRKCEIRFLELMKIGEAMEIYTEEFLSCAEILNRILNKYGSKNVKKQLTALDSTSFNYLINGELNVGFIASESQPFCQNCSRLRLDCQGNLRGCLMKEDKLNLKGKSFNEYPSIIQKVLEIKPTFRVKEINQMMNEIGG
jgi:cyclic pyranopterin phosphate synthase